MPMRFYNPVKDLCAKVNLDYETVLAYGVSPQMREAFFNADIQKPLEQIKSSDRKQVKHKMEFFDRKYGAVSKGTIREGTTEDKGAYRYNQGLVVQHICPDDSKMDESAAISNELVNNESPPKTIPYKRPDIQYIPGRGLINPNDMD